ncbi:hypothetical protein Tco_1461826, partial [Tanacetum coccineum]
MAQAGLICLIGEIQEKPMALRSVKLNDASRQLEQQLNSFLQQVKIRKAYDHQIYRYLDGGDSLHSTKDDECIVAYRLSRKQAKFPKLEICHRFLENLNP